MQTFAHTATNLDYKWTKHQITPLTLVSFRCKRYCKILHKRKFFIEMGQERGQKSTCQAYWLPELVLPSLAIGVQAQWMPDSAAPTSATTPCSQAMHTHRRSSIATTVQKFVNKVRAKPPSAMFGNTNHGVICSRPIRPARKASCSEPAHHISINPTEAWRSLWRLCRFNSSQDGLSAPSRLLQLVCDLQELTQVPSNVKGPLSSR